jgi:hypothetical protein
MRHRVIAGILAATVTLVAPACSKEVPAGATETGSKTESEPQWDYVAELKKLLPGEETVAGWNLAGEPSVLDGAALMASGFDRAALFQPYGVRYNMSARYVSTSSSRPPLRIDVYFLESSLSSFGVYTMGRTMESNFVSVGNQGIEEERQLRFWKGPLYTEITCDGAQPVPKGLLGAVGKDVAGRMIMTTRLPQLLLLLPPTGLVANSQRFGKNDCFGSAGPTMVMTAKHTLSGTTFDLALADASGEAQAKTAFQALRTAAADSGRLRATERAYGHEAFAEATPAGPVSFVVRSGKYLGRIDDVPGEPFIAEFLLELGERMMRAAEELEDDELSEQPSPGPAGGSMKAP